jgi:hypothetical protein
MCHYINRSISIGFLLKTSYANLRSSHVPPNLPRELEPLLEKRSDERRNTKHLPKELKPVPSGPRVKQAGNRRQASPPLLPLTDDISGKDGIAPADCSAKVAFLDADDEH